MNYHQAEALRVAQEAVAAGYRAFLAQKGSYGYITDLDGTRVVSFGVDLGRVSLGGNYITSDPRQTGTGWSIDRESLGDEAAIHAAMAADPPRWALGAATGRLKTEAEYRKMYQKSSRFAALGLQEHIA